MFNCSVIWLCFAVFVIVYNCGLFLPSTTVDPFTTQWWRQYLVGLGVIVHRQCRSHFGRCVQCTLSNKSAFQTDECTVDGEASEAWQTFPLYNVSQFKFFSSSVLQSRIQQWAWAPYCRSVMALLIILAMWPRVQSSFKRLWRRRSANRWG